MTVEECKNAIEELKAQGLTDEGIAASLYSMYQDDKIDLDQFDALVRLVGYELSDEFKAMSDEEKKSQEIGEFGMNDEDEENDTSNDDASNDDNQNDASNDEDENASNENEDEEENPFEKDYDKKPSDDEDEDEEAKKMFGFK